MQQTEKISLSGHALVVAFGIFFYLQQQPKTASSFCYMKAVTASCHYFFDSVEDVTFFEVSSNKCVYV